MQANMAEQLRRQQAANAEAAAQQQKQQLYPLELQQHQQAVTAGQQREALFPSELQTHEQAARVARQQGLQQTMGADLAQWADAPEYRGQDYQHIAPEAKQHMLDAYGEIANEVPSAWNAAQRTTTGNPEIGIPVTPQGVIESRTVNPKGDVTRSYQYDTSAQVEPAEGDPLSNLPKGEADMAREIAAYRFPFTSLSRIPGQQRLRILNAAAQVNPDFDANQYQTRQSTMKSFAAGPDAANIAAANTAIGHIDGMLKAGNSLGNTDVQLVNRAKNFWQRETGNPNQVDFATKADAVASELSKLFKGTGAATDQEIKEWRKNLSPAMSPEQIKAAANSAMELMASRLDALKSKYQGGMGKPPERSFLSPKSLAILRQNGLGVPESQGQTEATQEAPVTPQIPTVNSQAEYDSLPKGSRYQDSNGKTAIKR